MKQKLHVTSALVCGAVIALTSQLAAAQSSSLYLQQPEQMEVAPTYSASGRRVNTLAPAVAATSFAAVRLPEPRRFAVQDLVTIVIRESTQTDFESSLETEKSTGFDGSIPNFPNLTLRDLLNLQVGAGSTEDTPKLSIDYKQDWEGEGEYSRSDSITGRVTARVIDVKPNGTLVLEARKFIQSDKESLNIVLTGMCRAEDVGVDNTILSTQLYDLHLDKQHEGELKKTTKKGFLTKVFEAIFNF